LKHYLLFALLHTTNELLESGTVEVHFICTIIGGRDITEEFTTAQVWPVS
jgi:hypothetical protein